MFSDCRATIGVVTLDEDALKTATYAELAPLLCAGATVYDAIRASTWSPGDLCVVQGIGGLGHLAGKFFSSLIYLICLQVIIFELFQSNTRGLRVLSSLV